MIHYIFYCRTIFTHVGARLFAIALLLLLLMSSTSAQVKSTDATTAAGVAPGLPAGSYALSSFDNVNLYNGNLNFALPLVAVVGRGDAQYMMMLALNTKGWRVRKTYDRISESDRFSPTQYWWSRLPGYGPGMLQGRQVAVEAAVSACLRDAHGNPQPWPQYTLTTLTFTTPDGTEHELRDQGTNGQPLLRVDCYTGASRGTTFVSTDGTAMTFISDTAIVDQVSTGAQTFNLSGYLMLPNGTRYRIDHGLITWMRDRNGNRLTFTYDANGRVITVTDSLNRTVTITYADFQTVFYDQISFNGFGRAQRTIRVNYSTLSSALRDGYSIQTDRQLFPELNGASSTNSYNPNVVSSVTLPNGNQYQFSYNSYGELARVVLPTSGAIEYDMASGSGVVADLTMGDYQIFRRVAERRVYPDGGTGSSYATKTVYSATQSGPNDPSPWYTTVTVDQYDAGGTQVLTRGKHYFYGSAVSSLFNRGDLRQFLYSSWKEGHEYKTEAIDPTGAGTTVLRREENTLQQRAPVNWWTWAADDAPANDPRIVETVTTLVDTNQVAKQTSIDPTDPNRVGFDQYNNRTDTWEYDFGSGAPGPLVRHTHTDYLTTNPVNNTDYTGTSIHLRSLPSLRQVFDANGIEQARTSYEYDNYSSDTHHAMLVNRASISGLCTTIISPTQCDNSFSTDYQGRGNLTAVTRFLIVNGVVTSSVAAYSQYDIAGNVVKAIDPLGHQTTFDFSDRFGFPDGNARANTTPVELGMQASYAFATSMTNALGHTVYTQYDYYLGKSVDSEDANGIVSSSYYNDSLDRPTQVIRSVNINATQNQTTFSYNDTGRVITITSDQNTYGDNLLKSELLYDGLGRRTESHAYESSTAYIITKQTYDSLGRVWKAYNPYRTTTDSTYGRTETTYDTLSRVKRVETFDVSSVSTGAVQTAYSGNTVTVTDQAGKSRKSVTDALGRLTDVYEDPNAGGLNYRTTYTYDALDDLTGVLQGIQSRTFVYDSLKRLTSATNPESGTISYQYDANGNLILKIDPRAGGSAIQSCSIPYNGSNVAICYAYDALNRPTSLIYNDGTPSVTYSYDAVGVPYSKGRLTSVSNSVSSTSYSEFDALGRITASSQVTNGQTYSLSYGYDLSGNLTSETYPSGRIILPEYDSAGRIAGVKKQGGSYYVGAAPTDLNNRIQYAAQGAISSLKLGNGLWEHTLFNSRLQPTEIGLGISSTDSSTLKLNYGYGSTDNNGNVQSQTITLPGLTLSQSYTYDSLNRLLSAQEMNGANQTWKQSYTYIDQNGANGQFGNRRIDASNTTPNVTPAYNPTINPANNRFNSGQGYGYDNAGNLTNDPAGNTYSYDAENRQTLFNNGDVQIGGSYFYDGDGRRVKKVVGSTTTVYVYNADGQLIAEYSNTISSSYAGTSYLTEDSLGTPRIITYTDGSVKSRHDYLPFGEEIATVIGNRSSVTGYSTPDNINQKFTQKERDVESGLDYFLSRYYSSTQGRFTSADPLQASGRATQPQSWNRYAYVLNNPLQLTDPAGLIDQDPLCNQPVQIGAPGTSTTIQQPDAGPNGAIVTITFGEYVDDLVENTQQNMQQTIDQIFQYHPTIHSPSANAMVGTSGDQTRPGQLFAEFLTGTGPEERQFGPDSPNTASMRTSPFVDDARDSFCQGGACNYHFSTYGPAVPGQFGIIGWNTAGFGSDGIIRAGLDPTRQFVGSFTITIHETDVAQHRTLFIIENQTSRESFLYHIPIGNIPSSSGRPMSTIRQTFWWTENNPCGCRR